MSEKENESNEALVVQIPLEWDWGTDLKTKYVNHMRVTHAGSEFFLYFGELAFPGMLFEEGYPEKLTIKPKVRLAITAEQMGLFIDALNENYEKYLQKQKG
jgi:hypothetical protein